MVAAVVASGANRNISDCSVAGESPKIKCSTFTLGSASSLTAEVKEPGDFELPGSGFGVTFVSKPMTQIRYGESESFSARPQNVSEPLR